MHCCVLGFLSCSLFLHMSFELKLLLLLLWLGASCSLFLHSHAWLSDCLISHLYPDPLDSRCAQPLDRVLRPSGSKAELSSPHWPEPTTGQRGRVAEGYMGPGGREEAIRKRQGKGQP